MFASNPAYSAATDDTRKPEASRKLVGLKVIDVLETFRKQGLEVIYSSNYVTSEMLVLSEPEGLDPGPVMDQILQPYGLQAKPIGNQFVIVRHDVVADSQPATVLLVILRDALRQTPIESATIRFTPSIDHAEYFGRGVYSYQIDEPGQFAIEISKPGYISLRKPVTVSSDAIEVENIELIPGEFALDQLSVTTSRYLLFSNSKFHLDQQTIQAMPKTGDDPMRSVQRLQGTAANGLSSKTHIRGGNYDETSIYLNGLRLLDPFHIRDFHSIFSTLDARSISAIEVYTGGAPSEFGDALSGLIIVDSRQPDLPLHSEIGLSLFNTSLLNSGYSADDRFDWLVSARRSNLDEVLDEDLGEPNYQDVFASLGVNLNDRTRLTLNGLLAVDDVVVITESDPSELEKTESTTRNGAFWLRGEIAWSEELISDTVISLTDFSNKRKAQIEDVEEIVAGVSDNRTSKVLALRHNMVYSGGSNHTLRWGLELSRQKARYAYQGQAEYFGPDADFPGIQNPVAYLVNANPSGNSYGLFLSDQIQLGQKLTLKVGMRWDRQTYTEPQYDGQWSPKASLLYETSQRSSLRLTVGRYSQAQAISSLQVEDNVSLFNQPQRADQYILGYQWRTRDEYRFRIEAYFKDYRRVAPRYENLFDPLQMVPEFQLDRVRLEPQSAEAKGLELSVEHSAGEHLDWWASYTLSHTSDVISGTSELRSWDQRHAVQGGLNWRKGPWDFGIAGSIHSGWPTTALALERDQETGELLPKTGPRNDERFGVFATVDFRLSRRFEVGNGSLTGFIEATNSTNRNNPCCTDYGLEIDENGNTFLKAKAEYWLPILPSIGVLWEF